MKGSRNPMPSRQSGVSGEPILRPFSAGSRMSRTRTTSPTFDADASLYDPTPEAKDNEVIQMLRELSKSNEYSDSPPSRTQQAVMFPTDETEYGQFSAELLKILQRWFSNSGWPISYNPVRIPETFRA